MNSSAKSDGHDCKSFLKPSASFLLVFKGNHLEKRATQNLSSLRSVEVEKKANVGGLFNLMEWIQFMEWIELSAYLSK